MKRLIPSALFPILLAGCGSEEPPLLEPVPPEGSGGETIEAPGPVRPIRPGGRGGVTDELALPKGGNRGGGGVLIRRVSERPTVEPYTDEQPQACRFIGVAYEWGRETRGVQKLLRLTTRPQGGPNWPWITVHAWIPARGSLAEWTDRPLTAHKVSLMPGPGKSPWIPGARSTLTLLAVDSGRLRVGLDLQLRDPIDGNLKRITGKVVAVEGVRPATR